MVEMICGTCRFWDVLTEGEGIERDGNYEVSIDGTGRCRRYPPASRRSDLPAMATSGHSSDAASSAYWPVTWAEDWCGEHLPRLRSVS
jgi:hypothetical protein